jgi:pimeloyl-ACP methyl ester carboxylesterase
MWTFWPIVVTTFLAAFSIGHEQVRTGCNTRHQSGLVCRTSEIGPLDLATFRSKSERELNRTSVRGASIEEFQWNDAKEDPVTHRITESEEHPFSLGIAEYDDEGRAWSDDQIRAVKKLVSDATGDQDALILTFIHGWKNNCTTCNGNLACFREVLAMLSAAESDLAKFVGEKPRKIVGVYIGWRGETIRIPYADSISAFGRKAAADRVGGRTSDVTALLSWLNEEKVRANDRHRSVLGTRLIVVGHSFGADVLFGSIAGHLSAQLGASESGNAGLRAKAFADVTILVNPALEASLYRRFDLDARQKFAEHQLPLVITVQATNDLVTKLVFPIERTLVSLPDSAASREGYAASLAAVGHYAPYFTHTLCQPGRPGCSSTATAVETRLLTRLVTPPPKAPCGCDSFDASRDRVAAILRSLLSALQHMPDHDVRIGEPLQGLASDLEPLSRPDRPTNLDSPFLVVRATPDVVDKHSGIYRGQFFDFLVNMTFREQILENQALRRQLLRVLRVD